mgnify:CR=1 FL=1
MEKLAIQSTSNSPKIEFSPEDHLFELYGESSMDDAHSFYAPVLEWLKDFGSEFSDQIRFEFRFTAISQSSMKMLFFVCQEIRSMQIDGGLVNVFWHFPQGDNGLKEIGQDISYMAELDFDYVVMDRGLELA